MKYRVTMEITIGIPVYVEAQGTEEAKKKAKHKVLNESHYYVRDGYLISVEPEEAEKYDGV